MHTHLYLLIAIGALAGFFVRPLSMFIFGTVISFEKYTKNKAQLIILILVSALSTISLSFLSVYLLLKLSGFIPMQDNVPAFVVSFFVGGTLWVVYARLFNHTCMIDTKD